MKRKVEMISKTAEQIVQDLNNNHGLDIQEADLTLALTIFCRELEKLDNKEDLTFDSFGENVYKVCKKFRA